MRKWIKCGILFLQGHLYEVKEGKSFMKINKSAIACAIAICLSFIWWQLLPIALLVILPCMGTPLSVVWLFAKDVAIVLYVSVTVLFLMGVYKCGYLIKRKKG